jgi:hypothetical protein
MANRKTRRAAEKIVRKKAAQLHISTEPSPAEPKAAMLIADGSKLLWRSFIRAVGAEIREAEFIRGASGIHHPTLAVGVDDEKNRVIIISAEHDARAAAMAHADIQSALKSVRVVVARPIAINLANASRALTTAFGNSALGLSDLEKIKDTTFSDNVVKPVLEKAGIAFAMAFPNLLPNILQAIEQLSKIKVDNFENLKTNIERKTDGTVEMTTPFSFNLEALNKYDPTVQDLKFGICPVPLYDFSEPDTDLLLAGTDMDAIREVLKKHGILQYFYPAPDELALGLVDRGVKKPSELIEQLEQVPELGHPYGETEITSPVKSMAEIVDELRERKLIVEGEISMETTAGGEAIRQTVRFKPKEGLLSKLINRFELKIDLKDLFGGGK